MVFDQHFNENIIFVARRHWIVFISGLSIFIILVFLGFVGLTIVKNLIAQNVISENWSNLIWLTIVLYFHFVLISIFKFLVDYYLDLWIITNERIIDVEQIGFFNRSVSEFKISKVQNVTVEISGIIPTLLNYGNVKVETAGESSKNFVFYQIPNPNKAKEIILQQIYNKNSDL